ncbi:hypothetical protein NDA10_005381 [Ustilago hordei]|uniref:Uncharacterized protein n=1 Tax=Ustilago hordei TaxID=120017 RepID=I2FTS2_USTHO|nr:uncharacterized protein UHO2_06188 [Ustilago hordei]KAJ1037809.1 hypothetical protein NDA10_005381 [Ustilago hordei]KAJ1575026.1 hypothetical protein NDA15_004914 [Ustilago hordei]KAJ1593955.1 hypothetical protein NDA12_000567 [Ustilago hordei]UTT88653.1 hypothetical protein NDA17_005544 [Ustilago hordei]CCF50315.1 uncharacterized protein UHOR_07940 [Ustilago hordei]
MEATTLNVAAPPFQPGGGFSGNPPTARQPLPLQMPPSASGQATPLQERNGQQMLSQIQNQMVPGGGIPGGTISLSANSRPFVPGGANAPIFKTQTPTTPYHPGPPSVSNVSRSPLPAHRLGHGISPASVHLTGLPAFLATPPIMTNIPPQALGFAGPPSPLSPHASVPPSPFVMPQGQPNFGLPHPGGLMNGIKPRKGKGPQPVTPLKSTGHNSTPSISMNPAAFAASLAALKAKKKVLVSVPNEQPLPEDEELLAQEEQHAENRQESREIGEEHDATSDKRQAAKRRHARAAAATRHKWVQRQPWSSEQHDQVPCIQVPDDAVITCEIHPEPWPHSLGLPDTIDIYLPGMSAWDEYQEMRYEEQQMEAEAAEQEALLSLPRPKPLLPSQSATFNADHKGRSLSISSPADPSMVSFKLNRFLQLQQESQNNPNKPIDTDDPNHQQDGAKHQPFDRFKSDLPDRLRDAFARRRGEDTTELGVRPSPKHIHTMSLGLPSSGGPFGPEVFSALDMIRANSDEGPSKSPSETHDLPEKPLSDSEAIFGKTEPFLAQIVEDVAEEEGQDELVQSPLDAAKHSGSGNWKDLGRGFGYEETEAGATHSHGRSRRHVRQASRISVSTSHRGGEENGDELPSDGDNVEIRTNPSEDADASDFEEDLDEYGPEHWNARRTSAHLSAFGDAHDRHNYDDMSDYSDDDSLRDSLTPSDEQFSNPSDEEAAKEERFLRRQLRADERAARRERKGRQRGRANTDNTLPSSSIGEGDLHGHTRYDFAEGSAYLQYNPHARRSMQADIISNPSDEIQSDLDDTETFGHTDQSRRTDKGTRMSQDFRFPPPKPSASHAQQQAYGGNSTSTNGAPMSGTLGRASGMSMLNPGAKEFKFGGNTGGNVANRAVSAPVASNKDTHGDGEAGHFRLPSIKTSSFGSGALGDIPANAPHLNVGAPSFTPGSFTFKSAVRLQVPDLERGASPRPEGASIGITCIVGDDEAENREKQGREKRTRYGPIDYNSEDERDAEYNNSPPRPKTSAASIEGPMRDFSTLSRQGPPPFLPPGFQQQQRAVSHESRFTPAAPSFVPTWARGASEVSASTSFKRPTLPDWGQQAQGVTQQDATPSIRDPSFFTRQTGTKAIPIRRPSENDQSESNNASRSPQQDCALGQGQASQDRLSVESAPASSAASAEDNWNQTVANPDLGQNSTETLRAPVTWGRAARPESVWPAERSRPIQIPAGPHSYQSSAASLASDIGAGLSVRWGDRRPSSSIGMSSVDRRLRRSDRDSHGRIVRDGDDEDDEDESLTDFVEEIVERVDKALEGWAGKILDEVTIMGQVRPLPRGAVAAADLSLDQDKIVHELSRRMEEVLDNQLATTFSAHVRKSTDASDETQATVRPGRRRNPSADEKMAASGLVDAPGEWDFDYVQDVLEMKLGEFRQQIEGTMAQVMQKVELSRNNLATSAKEDERNIDGLKGLNTSGDMVEAVTSRLVTHLATLFESHTNSAKQVQSESETKLQQVMQAKLDENLFLLSEKSAGDRSNIQQMLESELHGLERSIGQVSDSVKEQLESALKECLPPLLEDKVANETSLADRLASQLGQILGPLLSEERRGLLEDTQSSHDLFLEALPSPLRIAQSTVKLMDPIVQSLKSEPVDSDALVTRLAEVIGKQSIEHMVDLNPVLALLEPLISKQEDARSMSKKILQQQEDTERTLSELPGAINAKTEIFLSSASETSEKQGLILQQIAEIKSELEQKASALGTVSAAGDNPELYEKLEDLAQGRGLMQETAEKTLSELAGVYQVLNSSYEALERLEKQYTSTEEVHRELTTKLEKQAEASSAMARELREAEARAARAEAEKAELAAKVTSSDKESATLRDQLAQMAAELAATKAERAKELDASNKAVSEAVARADRAESASAETQDRMGRLLEQATVAEREAYESAKSVLERASKAEGQVGALEKRIAEQDSKIANLQQLSATQKQKAAQSHQKLAEGEKRVKELEAKADQLSEATVRLGVLEVKAVELEETKKKLAEGEERETHMREEIRRYDERFSEMERDLVTLKDGFVEKTVHKKTQKQLQESEKLVEQLKAQIEAIQKQTTAEKEWEAVESLQPPTGAWASMHAPKLSKGGLRVSNGSVSADTLGELVMGVRSFSFASTGSRKEVEVDEGGWWS